MSMVGRTRIGTAALKALPLHHLSRDRIPRRDHDRVSTHLVG